VHCNNGGGLNRPCSTSHRGQNAGIEIFSIRFGDSDSTDVSLMKRSPPASGHHRPLLQRPVGCGHPEVFKLIGKQLGWRLLN
jgi:hypothetical protein